MKTSSLVVTSAMALAFFACSESKKEMPGRSYFDRAGMDTSIRPADNFYEYANGQWMKTVQIPGEESGWGSFYTLSNDNLLKLRGILEEVAKNPGAKGSIEQKLGDYYASGMDTAAIETAGIEPLRPVLNRIDEVKDLKELIRLLADLQAMGDDYLLGLSVGADDMNSTRNIVALYQAGLTLPEKEYYTRTDSGSVAIREAMKTYAEKLFTLTGTDDATASNEAENLLALETEMAASHRSPVELRDPQLNYNKISVTELGKQSPTIDWKEFFDKSGLHPDSVNLAQPGYYVALSKLLVSKPIGLWKTKLKFDYISDHSRLLGSAFTSADFEFNKNFSGQKMDYVRWKKMTTRVDGGLGEMLGQLYVNKYFGDTARQRMNELVNNLQKAFEIRIGKLDWMSDSTKQKAISKLHAFLKKIGHPTVWKNYDDVEIDRNNYFANAQRVRLHEFKEMVGKAGKPVDRNEWHMSPPTVNAYYNPTNNEIVFPAGILQYPFFDAGADDAINYGAIGMVIGHEMTHGFDDQGSQFDEMGNLRNWWTKSDNEKFKNKTAGVVNQYSAYKILNNMSVNGELTLGENIADIGGLAIAYDAFMLTPQSKDTTKIDGFTPIQRFFMGYAQVWRLKNTDETMRMRVTTDPHSPEIFRVNGPLSNFAPFYSAFNVKAGDGMYLEPEKRAAIW